MGRKIVIGPYNTGLTTNRTAFVINNDAFPQLINAYQWRGRVKRKRGTEFLTRLTRSIDQTNIDTAPGAGTTYSFDLKTLLNLESNAQLQSGSIEITIGGLLTVEDDGDGTWTKTAGTATLDDAASSINYNTGAGVLELSAGAYGGEQVDIVLNYFPVLPVMGLKSYIPPNAAPDQYINFDTVYAYETSNAYPYPTQNVNFYKNPTSSGGYTAKTTATEFVWNGEDYQLFEVENYQGGMFACNGITIPFVTTNLGMQFNTIATVDNITAGPPASADITFTGNHGLVVGDWVFINEVVTTTGINFQTGYVITVVSPTEVRVEFPEGTIASNGTGGIAQYLTNSSDPTTDCIRWYDGNPRTSSKGWVNFCPPLSEASWAIGDTPELQYYLVGARKITAFKDRLLFFGAVVQTSSGNPIYLQDTVVYSGNGVPFYTASFPATTDAEVSLPTTDFTSYLVPDNQTAFPPIWFEDQSGFGGFVQTGLNQRINTVENNDDVLIIGLSSRQVRLVYTSNDLLPFQFYEIDSSLGSSSPQSTVNINDTVVSRGDRGFVATVQTQASRFDEEIPDEVYQTSLDDNGSERVHGIRDYINEWAYFSYPYSIFEQKFPSATLQYNYKDKSWGLFFESYTSYGNFKKRTGFTWGTVGEIFPTWNAWNEPWNAGESTLLQPVVTAGNQQGFVLIRGNGTSEGKSLTITGISGNTITSPDHGLNTGDYITINGALGTNVSEINGLMFSIEKQDEDTFELNPPITGVTYTGNGVITRFYVPFIQSKQFATDWNDARKTRLGPQQYMLTTTPYAQVSLYIYLSMDSNLPFNNSTNAANVFSTILYTCPESTNLGLTPANVNLQMPNASGQEQIWHRINTSLLGDVVQFAITLNDEQMRDISFIPSSDPLDITGITAANPCVVSVTNTFNVGDRVLIQDVEGMIEINPIEGQPNSGIYLITARTSNSITLDLDASTFSAYTSGGTVVVVNLNYQFAEIELHGAILDTSPSGLLA